MKYNKKEVMTLAWQLIKKNGYSLREAVTEERTTLFKCITIQRKSHR